MIAFYVTGHGYGHATRASALAAELKRREPGLDLESRTEAPAWIFTEALPGAAGVAGIKVSCGGADPGMVQRDALSVDRERSLECQLALDGPWAGAVRKEAAW